MPQTPRNISDLFFAPVVLEIEARLEHLGGLSPDALEFEIVLEANRDPKNNSEERHRFVHEDLVRNLDLHGWKVAWDPRGVRLSHGDHAVVLGWPPNLRNYLQA